MADFNCVYLHYDVEGCVHWLHWGFLIPNDVKINPLKHVNSKGVCQLGDEICRVTVQGWNSYSCRHCWALFAQCKPRIGCNRVRCVCAMVARHRMCGYVCMCEQYSGRIIDDKCRQISRGTRSQWVSPLGYHLRSWLALLGSLQSLYTQTCILLYSFTPTSAFTNQYGPFGARVVRFVSVRHVEATKQDRKSSRGGETKKTKPQAKERYKYSRKSLAWVGNQLVCKPKGNSSCKWHGQGPTNKNHRSYNPSIHLSIHPSIHLSIHFSLAIFFLVHPYAIYIFYIG